MNNESKHTPGPWKITQNTTSGQFVTDTKIKDSHESVIAVMHCNALANALLISAAPDLLEALEYIVGWNSHAWNTETARNLARAAIAKARGEK